MIIPKPLVTANQWFLVISITISLLFFKWILLLPLSIGLLTLFTHKNLVILIGKRFLRKPLSYYQKEDKSQQQFNQFIATICLVVSVICFSFGWNVPGYLFALLVIIAAGVALMGFCIGCFIRFQYQQWRYRYKQSNRV